MFRVLSLDVGNKTYNADRMLLEPLDTNSITWLGTFVKKVLEIVSVDGGQEARPDRSQRPVGLSSPKKLKCTLRLP